MDRLDKLAFMEAWNTIPLYNKMCRATRRKLKRQTSKAVRSSQRKRDRDEMRDAA